MPLLKIWITSNFFLTLIINFANLFSPYKEKKSIHLVTNIHKDQIHQLGHQDTDKLYYPHLPLFPILLFI